MTPIVLSLVLSSSPILSAQPPLPPGYAPLATPQSVPPGAVLLPAPPMTHYQFAKVFVPIPGTHKVVLLHPKTKQPVEVCFTLPPGCPEVNVGCRSIEFEYDDLDIEVEIRFRIFGRVTVDYDD